MEKFEKVFDNIYRLKVPFDGVMTSVFAVVVNGECIIMDAATTESDVNNYILPAIKEAGFNVKKLLVSHEHGDHAGGLQFLALHFPEAEVYMFSQEVAKRVEKPHILKDGEMLLGCIKIINLPAHSPDCLGALDTRTGVLLSFDSLQLFGVGKYGTYIRSMDTYRDCIEKLRKENIKHILAAHDYLPLGDIASGPKEIEEYYKVCLEAPIFIKEFVEKGGVNDPATIAAAYVDSNK